MSEPLFSYYDKGIFNKFPTKQINLKTFCDLIKNPDSRTQKTLDSINQSVKQNKPKKEIQQLKQALPYVTFAGEFNKRSLEGIKELSNYAVLDFDNIQNAKDLKKEIIKDPFVKVCFISPSQKGLKVVIELSTPTLEDYQLRVKSAYAYFEKKFNIKGDLGTSDYSRACYIAKDKDVFYNSSSSVYSDIIKDPLNKKEEYKEVLKPLQKVNLDRSEEESKEVLRLISKGLNKEQIFLEMNKFSKWGEESSNYRERTYIRALEYFFSKNPQNPQEEYKLESFTIDQVLNFEETRDFFLQDIYSTGSLNMLYSKPGVGKSIIALYQALCISQGINFLGQQTTKKKVVYFDWENPKTTLKERLNAMCKGLKVDSSNLNFFISSSPIVERRRNETKVKESFINAFEEYIKTNKTEVVFIDTIRRLGSFDENDSQTINAIYNEFFSYFRANYNISFIFIHHTNKNGEFRGSIDLEAICDAVYQLKKTSETDYILQATKRRNAELENLPLSIDFVNDEENTLQEIKFLRKSAEFKQDTNKYKEIREFLVNDLDQEKEFTFTDLLNLLQEKELINSKPTFQRALNWFTDKKILYKDEIKKVYFRPKKDIKEHISNVFSSCDIIKTDEIISRFGEQATYTFLEKWFSEGLIFEPKKGELHKTDKLREKMQEANSLNVEKINLGGENAN